MTDRQTLLTRWIERGRRLEVPTASTHVWDEGEGEPVLLLHGVPASSYLYRKVLPALAERGLRGVAMDFPGLGLADRPEDFDYRWSGLATWLRSAVDTLGLDRFHLVIHDIGGPIGYDLASRIPDRIRSLTVLNTMTRVASFHRPWVMEPFAWPVVGPIYLATTSGALFEILMRLQGVHSKVPGVELRVLRRPPETRRWRTRLPEDHAELRTDGGARAADPRGHGRPDLPGPDPVGRARPGPPPRALRPRCPGRAGPRRGPAPPGQALRPGRRSGRDRGGDRDPGPGLTSGHRLPGREGGPVLHLT